MTRTLASLLLALTAAGCSLFDGPEPVPVGSFEVEITGDISARASGTAFVAEPDSGLNVRDMEWQVDLPISFETTAGDSLSLYFSVHEPTEPNGPFAEIPEGTFQIDVAGGNPAEPLAVFAAEAQDRFLDATDGTATLRRLADGSVEGEVSARYVAVDGWFGASRRGRIDLRFTARAPTNGDPAASAP